MPSKRKWSKFDVLRLVLLLVVAALQIGIMISDHKTQKLLSNYERICTVKSDNQFLEFTGDKPIYHEADPQNDPNIFEHWQTECESGQPCKVIGYLPTVAK